MEFLARKAVVYVGIDKGTDMTHVGTQTFIKELVKQASGIVAVWIATPCTAGCGLRHVNVSRLENFKTKGQKMFQLRQKMWRCVKNMFEGFSQDVILLIQEWPLNNSLWNEAVYQKVSVKLEICRGGVVINRCCLDGITRKQWELASNQFMFLRVAADASVRCQCSEPRQVSYYESGFYSRECVEFFWKIIRQTWNRLRKQTGMSLVDENGCVEDDVFFLHGPRVFSCSHSHLSPPVLSSNISLLYHGLPWIVVRCGSLSSDSVSYGSNSRNWSGPWNASSSDCWNLQGQFSDCGVCDYQDGSYPTG